MTNTTDAFVQGTGSFVKKTVFGFSDSFAKFTGSVGKGERLVELHSNSS